MINIVFVYMLWFGFIMLTIAYVTKEIVELKFRTGSTVPKLYTLQLKT